MVCRICGARASGGHFLGDSIVIACPKCGGYRMSITAEKLLSEGMLKAPTPDNFRTLVDQKRGRSAEYPLITVQDLRIRAGP